MSIAFGNIHVTSDQRFFLLTPYTKCTVILHSCSAKTWKIPIVSDGQESWKYISLKPAILKILATAKPPFFSGREAGVRKAELEKRKIHIKP